MIRDPFCCSFLCELDDIDARNLKNRKIFSGFSFQLLQIVDYFGFYRNQVHRDGKILFDFFDANVLNCRNYF